MTKKNSIQTSKTRESLASIKKERDEMKAAYSEMSGLLENSTAESMEMISRLQLENAALKVEIDEKVSLISKVTELWFNLVKDWESTQKWARFFVALTYIEKFVNLFVGVLTDPTHE
jgi:hypothetical protein